MRYGPRANEYASLSLSSFSLSRSLPLAHSLWIPIASQDIERKAALNALEDVEKQLSAYLDLQVALVA